MVSPSFELLWLATNFKYQKRVIASYLFLSHLFCIDDLSSLDALYHDSMNSFIEGNLCSEFPELVSYS